MVFPWREDNQTQKNFKLGNLHRRQPGRRLQARLKADSFRAYSLFFLQQEPDLVILVGLGERWEVKGRQDTRKAHENTWVSEDKFWSVKIGMIREKRQLRPL